MIHPHHAIMVLICLALVCHPGAARAAEPPCEWDDTGESRCDEFESILEHVLVTATRRESPVNEVPVSVTALSGERLREMGALVFEDYARSVPGLSFTDVGLGGKKFVIRGISTMVFAESRAATAVYLDETPITDGGFGGLSYSPDPLLVDIDRVEVLRGPQGTLFGAGAMGGAIRIISNQPNVLETQGFAEAGVSTTSHGGPGYEVQGMFNTPLFEGQAAIRGVALLRDLGGWIDNTLLGNRDVNNNENVALRLAGTWSGSERLTVNAKVVYQDRQSEGSGFDEGSPPWTQQRRVPEPNRDEWSLLNLDIHYRFGWGRLISATSWADRTTNHHTDATQLYLGPAAPRTVTAVSQGKQQEFVQEFRLQSTGEGQLDWLLGLFYQDQDYRLDHEVVLDAGMPDKLLVGETDRPTKETAAFGDFIWRFAERWETTLGGRWFKFEHSANSSVTGPLAGPGRFQQTEASETGFTPRLGMRYLTNDEVMFYGTVAGGYRPGGTNETVFEEFPDCREQLGWFGLTGIPLTYESDSLWSYELGVKSGWAARRIFLNAAVFYIDWSDMQTPAGLFCGANWVQNAGEATSKGAELELVAYPGRNLELTLNGTWTDARLDEDVPLMNGREGDRVPGVPEYAFGGSLSWFFDVSDGLDGSIRVDYQYVGSSPDGYSYWPWNQPGKILSYSLVNLHLSLGKGRWRVVLYARNLFDERAIITMHDDAAGPYVTTARPFTAGIRASLVY